jgi:hypothetical protein
LDFAWLGVDDAAILAHGRTSLAGAERLRAE